jgi:hypothetical protein
MSNVFTNIRNVSMRDVGSSSGVASPGLQDVTMCSRRIEALNQRKDLMIIILLRAWQKQGEFYHLKITLEFP